MGTLFPLVLPLGFYFTGRELWSIAEALSPDAAFLTVYMRVLVAFRFFLYAFAVASVGRLLVAWGAMRAHLHQGHRQKQGVPGAETNTQS